MDHFGERLAALRKERGLSQEDLAEKLQLTRQTISKWETGASTPDLELLIQLAEVFDVSTDRLLGAGKCANQEGEEKASFLTIFCLFMLAVFAAGIVLYIWETWASASLGLSSALVQYASLAMIFLPPLIILGIGIARYRDWRKTKK